MLGKETEKIEFKKSTSELKEALCDIGAILNKHGGGTLYFGVNNSGDIVGLVVGKDTLRSISRKIYEFIKPTPIISVEELVQNNLSYIKVSFTGTESPYAVNGAYYYRVSDESREMTRVQLKELFLENVYKEADWENALSDNVLNDVDEQLLKKVYNFGLIKGRFTEPYSLKEVMLKKLGLLIDEKLTNAGKVLFSNAQPIKLKMAVFATEEKITFIDMVQFDGNIFECIDEAMMYIKKHMNWRVSFGGIQREEIPEIPVEALREIIVNSFVHAKYAHMDIYHEIDVFPSKITIFNPGHLPLNLDPIEFATNNDESKFRNPKIANILYKTNTIEAFATGFARTFAECKKANVKYSYQNKLHGFEFTFHRDNNMTNNVTPPVILNMNETEKAVYDHLLVEPYCTIEDIAIKIGKSWRTTIRTFKDLQDKGIIERVGSKKTGYWRVIK